MPRLAEPDTQGVDKRLWSSLTAPSITLALAGIAGVAGALSGLAPPWAQPIWLVAAAAGVGLVMMDGLTTWISATATWATYGITGGALAGGILAGGGHWTDALWVVLGAIGAWVLFVVPWLVAGTFGFGDVRFAVIVGALGATLGITGWAIAISAGCLIAAGWTVIRRDRARPEQVHPWAPSLLAGAYVALTITSFLG